MSRQDPTLLELNLTSKSKLIKLIKCGGYNTMVITECGDCYVCGKLMILGQLGLGDYAKL